MRYVRNYDKTKVDVTQYLQIQIWQETSYHE